MRGTVDRDGLTLRVSELWWLLYGRYLNAPHSYRQNSGLRLHRRLHYQRGQDV
jgi:hypothetical protein